MKIQIKLQHLGACLQAQKWAYGKSFHTIWHSCYTEGWLNWLVQELVHVDCLAPKYGKLSYIAYLYGAKIAKKYKVRNMIPDTISFIGESSRSIRAIIPYSVMVEALRKYGNKITNGEI